MEPTALYDAHLSRSLYRVFRLLKTRMTVDSQYAALAEEYSADYESAWDALRFRYDADDLGRIDESQPKRGAQPQVWLGKLRRGGSW